MKTLMFKSPAPGEFEASSEIASLYRGSVIGFAMKVTRPTFARGQCCWRCLGLGCNNIGV